MLLIGLVVPIFFKFFIGLVVVIIIASIIISTVFSKKQIVLRDLSKFKHKQISQFKTNELTKVSGKVVDVNNPFIAPLSKRKCVAYIFEVKQETGDDEYSHWQTLVRKEDIQEFFVEKNGELVMVKPSRDTKNYNIYMVEDKKMSSGTFNDSTPELKEVFDNLGIVYTNWFGFNKTLK